MRYQPHSDETLAHWRGNPRRRLLWGLSLIAIGTAFLLDRMAWIDLSQYLGLQTQWWHFFPLLLALGGAITVLSARSLRQVFKGLIHIVLGVWAFACLEHLGALSFDNSWPILLIAFGLQMLLRGWLGGGHASCQRSAS